MALPTLPLAPSTQINSEPAWLAGPAGPVAPNAERVAAIAATEADSPRNLRRGSLCLDESSVRVIDFSRRYFPTFISGR
jgi:hypothetical protein